MSTIRGTIDMKGLGEHGERDIRAYIESRPGVHQVERIGDEAAVNGLSIDLKVWMVAGEVMPVEVNEARDRLMD